MFRSRQNYSVPKHLFKFDGELEEEEESEEEDLVSKYWADIGRY